MRWEVPTTLLESARLGMVDGMSLFLVGRNLVTWTDYKGFDPEIGRHRANRQLRLSAVPYGHGRRRASFLGGTENAQLMEAADRRCAGPGEDVRTWTSRIRTTRIVSA